MLPPRPSQTVPGGYTTAPSGYCTLEDTRKARFLLQCIKCFRNTNSEFEFKMATLSVTFVGYFVPAKSVNETTERHLLIGFEKASLTVYTDGFRACDPFKGDETYQREAVIPGEGEYIHRNSVCVYPEVSTAGTA